MKKLFVWQLFVLALLIFVPHDRETFLFVIAVALTCLLKLDQVKWTLCDYAVNVDNWLCGLGVLFIGYTSVYACIFLLFSLACNAF